MPYRMLALLCNLPLIFGIIHQMLKITKIYNVHHRSCHHGTSMNIPGGMKGKGPVKRRWL